jgi:signal transduction histidine kinase
LYAGRQFNAAAMPQKEIHLTVHPPFWETWWFISLVAAGVVLLLFVFINQHNRQQFEKKLQRLEAEKNLKQERERISKDLHDSLGAYANAVLYNIELLESEKEEAAKQVLLGELRFASKDIMTSLRETVWALKKESYTAEECFLRIRNFIQPLTRYFSHIHFSVEGDTPTGVVLHYADALNLVRIVQEAVSNSIKHAGAKNVLISSSVAKGEWMITVQDDGTGFDYPLSKQKDEGNGLYNMQYRGNASGIAFSINAANGGTRVVLRVALPAAVTANIK